MAESVDALDSKSNVSDDVRVRVPPGAPSVNSLMFYQAFFLLKKSILGVIIMRIETRNLIEKDIESLIPVLLDTWDYDFFSSLENREKATELYLLHALSISDYKKVLLIDGKVSGVITCQLECGYIDEYYSKVYSTLSKEYRNDEEVNELCKYNDVLIKADEELLATVKERKQEVVLLILSSLTKGKGCGKLLIEEFDSKRDKSIPAVLTSDTDCNYHFYEHFGYRIISSKKYEYEYFNKNEILESYLFYLK